MRRKLNINKMILFDYMTNSQNSNYYSCIKDSEENLCLDLTKERIETPQCKNCEGHLVISPYNNWRAQSKNDPLIFRPFLKVFRSS